MKIAFVTPFYGATAAGGAESECRQTALRLANAGLSVEVLTTCLLDLQHDWNVNTHPAGLSHDGPVTVRRFYVEPTELTLFGQLNQRLLSGESLSATEERLFAACHVTSCDMLRYLSRQATDYDALLFIPYLFGTTLFGLPLCKEKAVLIPCLHEEGYARMNIVRQVFEAARKIIYHTEAEKNLARRLYGTCTDKGVVLGEGVNTRFASDANAFRKKFGIEGPFLLYVGRKDPSKGTDILIRLFMYYARNHKNPIRLILMGPGRISIPNDVADHILDLGYVCEEDKHNAYSAALALCQPSKNESFSLVMMESWVCGTPCVVNENCEVTKAHVIESGGGLYFSDAEDFVGVLDYLLTHPQTAHAMGQAGRTYVLTHYTWENVVRRYREFLKEFCA